MQLRAGSLVVLALPDVRGFRLVLARDWHGPRLSMQTAAAPLLGYI